MKSNTSIWNFPAGLLLLFALACSGCKGCAHKEPSGEHVEIMQDTGIVADIVPEVPADSSLLNDNSEAPPGNSQEVEETRKKVRQEWVECMERSVYKDMTCEQVVQMVREACAGFSKTKDQSVLTAIQYDDCWFQYCTEKNEVTRKQYYHVMDNCQ